MPFISKERRHMIDKEGMQPETPGDLCYTYYKPMIEKWRADKRWTTVHEIYQQIVNTRHLFAYTSAAQDLAWQVFFALEVIPYELQKRKENGDI